MAMYHIPDPQKVYNKEFVKEFVDTNKVQSEPIKEWRKNPEKHKNESSGMYLVDSLSPPYCYAAAMMCRLFGNNNSARFSIQMVPLILAAVNSEIMDWAVLLSDRIANRILEYRQDKIAGNTTPFFFCAYILDALCFNSEFPLLGWKWTSKYPTPIHIYHKLLWKVHFKDHVYRICHGFLIPFFQTIFNRFPPRFSDKAKTDLSLIGD